MSGDAASTGYLGAAPRLPPSNVAAECSLLGAILANNKAYDLVSGFLQPDHFIRPENARIYQTIAMRIEDGQIVDAVYLKAAFENTGILDDVGGVAYLTGLLAAMVGIINAGDYGRAIHDCWVRRRQIDLAEDLLAAAYGNDPDVNALDVLGQHEDEVSALREECSVGIGEKRGIVSAWDAFKEAVDHATARSQGKIPNAYSTGFPSIDRMLDGGIAPQTLIYMLGASQAGKSELAFQIAENVAVHVYNSWIAGGRKGKCPAVIYKMLGDMSTLQMGERMAARWAMMKRKDLHNGKIDMLNAEKLVQAEKDIISLPLEIIDTGPSTVGGVVGDIRRATRRRPVAFVVVDNFSDMLSVVPDRMPQLALSITKTTKSLVTKKGGPALMMLMHVNSSVETERGRNGRLTPADIPYKTKKDAHYAIGVRRPYLYLPSEPEQIKGKLTAEGHEVNAKWRQEWQDQRESWPLGVANVSEITPMKAREEDEFFGKKGTLWFDRNVHRFFDAESNEGASPEEIVF
jgi:replicative DNA helicase